MNGPTCYRDAIRTFMNIYDGVFFRFFYWLKAAKDFRKKAPS